MAEVMTNTKSSGRRGSKLKTIHVDMTPMVDLGFLLITFFMFATTFLKPNVMNLGLPAKTEGPTGNVIDTRNQLTFILGDNRIFYYQKEVKDLTPADIKEVPQQSIAAAKTIQQYRKVAPKPEIFTVIIKPTEDANYSNFVDMMDELQIAKSERYGITDLQPKEKEIYKEIIQ